MIYSITIMVTAKKKKRYSGCLAHAVIDMSYSVVANQCQPRYRYNASVPTEANYYMYTLKMRRSGGKSWEELVAVGMLPVWWNASVLSGRV